MTHLKAAQNKCFHDGLDKRVDFVMDGVHSLSFKNNAFDFIIVIDILYTLLNLISLIGLERIMKHKAWLFLIEKTLIPTVAQKLYKISNENL